MTENAETKDQLSTAPVSNMGSDAAPQSSKRTAEGAPSNKTTKKNKSRKTKQAEPGYPVTPIVIQRSSKPRSFVNHSYRDFAVVPSLPTDTPLAEKEIADMTFSEKLHHILSQAEYERWIAWNPHGRSFHVLVPKRLEQALVLQKYYGHSRYSNFLRHLTNFGFKHLTHGADRNSFYHECFLRGLPHLLKYMPPAKDVRRRTPDPQGEPDFQAIAKKHPLPSDDKKPAACVTPPNVPAVAKLEDFDDDCVMPLAKIRRVQIASQFAMGIHPRSVLDVTQARAHLLQVQQEKNLLKNFLEEQQV